MANTNFAVDWAVAQGANAIECDIHFDGSGKTSLIGHGPHCDCGCATGNDHICFPLQNQCWGVKATANPATYMQNIARHSDIALYFVDSKVSSSMGQTLVKAGRDIISFMDKNLFGYGYKGKVVISSASFGTFAYVQAAAIAAKASRNAHRYFFTVDQEGNNYEGVMNKLCPYTNNKVYGTGTGSCGTVSTYYNGIKAAVVGKRHDVVQTIEPKSGPWGEFTNTVYCETNTWAIGFRQRVEKPCDKCDDTALNALELLCGKKDGTSVKSIKAHDGFWGDWSEVVRCPGDKNFLKGVSFKIEPPQELGDDTAANDCRFACSRSSNIFASNGDPWGDWQEMKYCPPSTAICGFSLKLENMQDKEDDTAANGAKFECCSL
ncbi:unnamed protein product [Rotaria sp. Silwood2]|nr:unnamed protein product [Rotaria sp. Silwood2]CAF3093326.1 unnamed protein product [Rotaria sp. Silwood2]CAF3395996.1 unnamed protein product [Rotaria sp. Silwood2]CAF4319085.1 unnamed protein product [Rotaria sp. Silwood2]CAF4385477.1 unnamed protein product [Rotaria sp. Silwood2]